jgi:DNA-binding GntR family transcriptional regulator
VLVAQAVDRAYEVIREGILTGEHEQGARLREEELADAIGVSRTPVREALRRLTADGLVELGNNRGAQVVSYTDEDLAEIFELRALLESHAHGLAAELIDAAAIEHLRELAEAMEELGEQQTARSRDRIAELNREFHATIVHAAGSTRLEALLHQVVQVPLVHRTFHRYSPEALRRSFDHHRELIAALDARDGAWAEAVMRSHVHAARAVLLGGRR